MKTEEFITIHTPISVQYDGRFVTDNYREVIQELLDSSDERVVLISYLPSQVTVINQLTGDFKLIYECVDKQSDFSWQDRMDIENETILIQTADVITTNRLEVYLSKAIDLTDVFSRRSF